MALRRGAIVLFGYLLGAVSAWGQAAFEVASIKSCAGGEVSSKSSIGAPSQERLSLRCQTVADLIQWAYGNFGGEKFDPMAVVALEGGPAWMRSEQYVISAKAEEPEKRSTINGAMLRALLEERFQLKVHRETRSIPVYLLTVARSGAKLRVSKGDCIAMDFEHPMPLAEPGKQLPKPCGMARMTDEGWDAPGTTMAVFTRLLADRLDRPVADRTGIQGAYDIHLDVGLADLSDAGAALGALKSAVRGVGLRLDAGKGPGMFLVIDRVERPSEN